MGWGRIAAHHPGWEDLLVSLIASARIAHEAFASFMSVSLLGQRHADVDSILQGYPAYLPLVRRMRRLLAPVPGGHRQDLAATGIARFCMDAPILELAVDRYPDKLLLSDVPSSWRPDQRFALVMASSHDAVDLACREAARQFEEVQGTAIDELAMSETDERLDSAWDLWESTFIDRLCRSRAQLTSLARVDARQHLLDARRLADAAAANGVLISLPHEDEPGPMSDVESVQHVLAAAKIGLRPEPWPSLLGELGANVDIAEAVALAAVSTPPFMVIHGRSPTQLTASFGFRERDARTLSATGDPVFAIRLLIDDEGRDVLLHAAIPTPEMYQRVVKEWPDDHVVANCITASCFLEVAWQHEWLPVLNRTPTVILLDLPLMGTVGVGRLLGANATVHGIYLGIGHPTLTAMVWHVEDHPHVMLAIGDDLTIQLLAGQLEDLLGDRLHMRDSDWSEWLPTLAAVCGSIIGTEHSLRFDGYGRI